MASSFTPKHISSAHLLGRVDPKVLFRLLKKYGDFFKAEGVMPKTADEVDHDRLSFVLAAPSEEMPAHLMADLFYWDEVAQMAQIEDLNEIAAKHGIEFSDEVTIEEAALLVRLDAPDDLEDLHAVYHAHGLLRRKKRFLSYFATVVDLPNWRKPTQKALTLFAQDMDNWYAGQKKGRGATRVSVIDKTNAAWFVIRHGGTFKRVNTLENGESKIVFYRPEAYDLLIYYYKQGELAIFNDGDSKKERRAYCFNLGKNLFRNAAFFEQHDAEKFSLTPLREKGQAAMDCDSVEGVASAQLCRLRYRHPGKHNHRVTHTADDLFGSLDSLGEQIPDDAELECMEVKLTPSNALGRERGVRIYSPNISVYDHEADAEIAHEFLKKQGFILPRNGTPAP